MPKFMTYQRPAPVTKKNWNHAPDKGTLPGRKMSEPAKPTPAPALPPLDQLLQK